MSELSIGEVARRAGVRTSTIRYYESIRVLPEPRRRGGQRRYDPAIVERLAFIQTAQRLGFALADIETLFQANAADEADDVNPAGAAGMPLSERWQSLARQKLAEVDQLIRQAAGMRRMLARGLRCGCPNLHECIHCVLGQCGSVRTAYPFPDLDDDPA